MQKRKIVDRIYRFLKFIYIKLFRINDSPQKIALGFALGVFLGVLPGTGPIASLFLAMLFRVNRASALLGCLLTNTWISIVAFLLSIKVGSVIMRLDWHSVHASYLQFIKDFHWVNLLKLSALKVVLPVIIGYFVVSFVFAALSYLAVIIVVTKMKLKRKKII
jgi:uncharacterized protein (DUF2062 family)